MDQPISVRGLRKTYGTRQAVDGIDLQIERGEVFALLGPNGAGKTTTVEILEGFRRRDGGAASVLGVDPDKADRAWRNRIGIVLQSSTGLDLITPREALRSTAKVYSHPRDVDEVLEATGLADKADDRIAKLSGGQRRRLDVALGIVGSPELLFLDEPTTGFDPQARRDFWELISSLAHSGTTILLTTHYLDEAEHLADRVGVIAAGRMLALDTPANLGGRSSSEAVVAWEDAAGTRHTERTSSPTQVVTRLAAQYADEIPKLTVTRPSLEDTYLELIAPHLDTVPVEHPSNAMLEVVS
jgi:ABC-2 type transport system ATP-binding protein